LKISLVIITRNRSKLLKRCLESISRQTTLPNEILIVDNNSTDGTMQTALAFAKKLPIKCLLEKKIGYSFARNFGAKKASGDIIAFTDDDCVADKNWIRQMKKSFSIPGVDLFGGEIKPLKTSNQTEIQKFLDSRNNLSISIQDHPLKRANLPNLAAKKKVLEKTGFFDEQMKSNEDTDFFWRAQEQGFNACLNLNAIIYHENRKTLAAFLEQLFRYGRYAPLLAKKHKKFDPAYYNSISMPKIITGIFLGISLTLFGLFFLAKSKEKFFFGLERTAFFLGATKGKIETLR